MFVSDLNHSNPSLEKKLRSLYALSGAKVIDLSFRAPYLNLLKNFGNPHKSLPPVIHVAGTNGKGSVVAMLKSILEAAGYRVHAYTSPHLVHFNERICLSGKNIDDACLEQLIDEAIGKNNGAECTFFEITTAMAMAAFARVPADILLLEVGMGGRLDCTNVIENPLITVITSIGFDHAEHLGDSLCKIAGEKAGIIKSGVPCVIGYQSEESIQSGVMNVFENKARETGSRLICAGSDWFIEAEPHHFKFEYKLGDKLVERFYLAPNLKGEHQVQNCGAALAALQVISDQFPVPDAAIETGLQDIKWPARLQDITENFKHTIPDGWEVFLDGAHNTDAARVLSTQAALWRAQDPKSMHLIVGMMTHKDPVEFLKPLVPFFDSVRVVDIPGEGKALKAAQIESMIPECRAFPDFMNAVKDIATQKKPPGRILIAGSLYLAGHVLKTLSISPHNIPHEL
jgi:dihydrofolate synthase/folylpolyglutamate synthase